MIPNSENFKFTVLERRIVDHCDRFPEAQGELAGIMESLKQTASQIANDNREMARLYGGALAVLDEAYSGWKSARVSSDSSDQPPPHIARRLFGSLIVACEQGVPMTPFDFCRHTDVAGKKATSRRAVRHGFKPRRVVFEPLLRHG
jgi:hypothetical protein